MIKTTTAKTTTAMLALTLFGVTAVAGQAGGMQRMQGQMSDSTPSMGMAHGMMMGGMMGHGMMGSGMMPMMGQGMGMMATGGPGPTTLLRMRDALELSDDQVARLQELEEAFQEETGSHMNAAMASHEEAARALQGDAPDLGAYQQSLQAAANVMVQFHAAMARAAIDAREVLTPEQRERLNTQGAQMMGDMMRGPDPR
ncbi:MAG: periplasmic heavy metal sensor [Gemmatimonadota bacterium]|nr:periplasmic heavy metal sensor [Gemmatimonadota bacterium]